MADGTAIEWTDATWNPITGCSVISPGCTNCYAMRLAGTRLRHDPSRAGLTRATKAGPVWTGEVRLNEHWLDQPLRWRRPRRIFVCAHGDLFHEAVPVEWIDRVFAVMALAPQHTFQVLTKRAARMRDYLSGDRWTCGHATERIGYRAIEIGGALRITGARGVASALIHGPTPNIHGVAYPRPDLWPLPNVWLGVSVEDQARADERIPILLDTPAAVRWVSAEPLLGPIDLTVFPRGPSNIDLTLRGRKRVAAYWCNGLTGQRGVLMRDHRVLEAPGDFGPHLDWVVGGGESGPGARPMHPHWARSLRDQCAAADVPFFWKQNGEFLPVSEAWGPAAASPDDLRGCVFVDPYGNTRRLHEAAAFGAWAMHRVGKKAAGRLLDGVIHDARPGPRP